MLLSCFLTRITSAYWYNFIPVVVAAGLGSSLWILPLLLFQQISECLLFRSDEGVNWGSVPGRVEGFLNIPVKQRA